MSIVRAKAGLIVREENRELDQKQERRTENWTNSKREAQRVGPIAEKREMGTGPLKSRESPLSRVRADGPIAREEN